LPDDGYILEANDITKRFPGVVALEKVKFRVKPGQVHALMGENGAGKSTLMKIILGIYKPDEGKIYFEGKEVSINNSRDALKLGISMIHQEISLVKHRTVAENIWLGREPCRYGFLNWKELYRKTDELLKRLNLNFSPDTLVKNISVGGMQMVEIARAISCNAKVIIMDEPTSALMETEVNKLFSIINDLKDKKIAVIYISHKMDEIFKIADAVTVFRDGQYVGEEEVANVSEQHLVQMMIGRELNQMFPKAEVPITKIVMEVKNLSRKGVFEKINFSVRKGEILGISGLMGAGRSELMQAIFGIEQWDEGELFIEGQIVKISSPKDAIDAGIGMVTEDRKTLGLVTCRSVLENVTYASLDALSTWVFINSNNELDATRNMINLLDIKTTNHKQPVENLSGGNQQKVVIANWLLTKPRILILDEPTRGIDVGAKSEIHKLMCRFACEGMGIIMISSEMPEILGMSDRILVMHNGRIKAEFSRNEATQEKIIASAMGVEN
jgi:inositol transport system ATP-binding protein